MSGADILNYVNAEILVLIPVLIIVGQTLKQIPKMKNWIIPIVLAIFGIIIAAVIMEDVVGGVIQGILAAGMAVYVHQLTIQTTRKKKEDMKEK
ncbi:phage holin family protein [Tepidimicrobium xylanilyticum]